MSVRSRRLAARLVLPGLVVLCSTSLAISLLVLDDELDHSFGSAWQQEDEALFMLWAALSVAFLFLLVGIGVGLALRLAADPPRARPGGRALALDPDGISVSPLPFCDVRDNTTTRSQEGTP